MGLDTDIFDLIKKVEHMPSEVASLDLDEFSRYMKKNIDNKNKDLEIMFKIQILTIRDILLDPIKKIIFEKVINFLNHLEKEGFVAFDEKFKELKDEKDPVLVAQEMERLEVNIQSYDEDNPDHYSKQICDSYLSFYELVINELKYYAEAIKKQKISSKGTIVKTLQEYENGQYKELFDFFNNHIRNAIGHRTYHLNKDKTIITFIDRDKKVKRNFKELHLDIDCMFNLSLFLYSAEFFKRHFKI